MSQKKSRHDKFGVDRSRQATIRSSNTDIIIFLSLIRAEGLGWNLFPMCLQMMCQYLLIKMCFENKSQPILKRSETKRKSRNVFPSWNVKKCGSRSSSTVIICSHFVWRICFRIFHKRSPARGCNTLFIVAFYGYSMRYAVERSTPGILSETLLRVDKSANATICRTIICPTCN